MTLTHIKQPSGGFVQLLCWFSRAHAECGEIVRYTWGSEYHKSLLIKNHGGSPPADAAE